MKLWHTIFIAAFITIYGTLSLVLLGGWVVERIRVLRESLRRPCLRKGLYSRFNRMDVTEARSERAA